MQASCISSLELKPLLTFDGILQAVQQAMEDRLIGFREDMQASNQRLTQQFAQHQVSSLSLSFTVLAVTFAATRKQQHGVLVFVRPQ